MMLYKIKYSPLSAELDTYEEATPEEIGKAQTAESLEHTDGKLLLNEVYERAYRKTSNRNIAPSFLLFLEGREIIGIHENDEQEWRDVRIELTPDDLEES